MTDRPADAMDLPGEGWAVLRTPADLTNRDRKLLRRYGVPFWALKDKIKFQATALGLDGAAPAEPAASVPVAGDLTADDLDVISDAQAAFIVAYVKAWSLDMALPTMDTVDDIPAGAFDALAAATAKLGDGTVDTGEPSPDPASPSEPSPV